MVVQDEDGGIQEFSEFLNSSEHKTGILIFFSCICSHMHHTSCALWQMPEGKKTYYVIPDQTPLSH